MYLLWHTQRQGWVGKSGTTTDIKDAQQFDRAVAIERSRSTRDHQMNYTMVPVNEDDLK